MSKEENSCHYLIIHNTDKASWDPEEQHACLRFPLPKPVNELAPPHSFCSSHVWPAECADCSKFLLVLSLTGSQILPSLQLRENRCSHNRASLQLLSVSGKNPSNLKAKRFIGLFSWVRIKNRKMQMSFCESHQLVARFWLYGTFKEAYGPRDVPRLHPGHSLWQRVRVRQVGVVLFKLITLR